MVGLRIRRIYDLGFTIYDLGFTIYDLGFTIGDLGFGIWDPTSRASLQLVRKKRQNSLNVYPSLFFVLCSLLFALKKYIQMKKYILYSLLVCGSLSGCIKADLEHCNKRGELIIKAIDTDGTDITASGEAGDVLLFIFDDNGAFISKQVVHAQDITNGKTLPISLKSAGANKYVAWGNIADTVRMVDFDAARTLADNNVLPLRDADGFGTIPRDFFYGNKRVAEQDIKNNPLIELLIRRAPAQLHVSVVGLPPTENPKNYSIVVGNDDQTALNFENRVQRKGSIQYRQEPAWLIDEKMMGTTKVFTTLPSPAGASKTVLLYKNGELIASATQDIQGKPIAPPAGQRSSVLIDLNKECACPDDSGIVEVRIVVSDWNQVVEWKEW